MKDSLTQITIVLDRSGSMSAVRDATISGFNEFVEGQKAVPGSADLTLIQFDSENAYEVVFDKPITEVKKLTVSQYVPRGGTPLHDALGRTITELGAKLSRMREEDRPGKIVIVTMTDGLENASHEYDSARIAEMIKHQREAYKWEFIFLGANQDAILTGERLNIPKLNSMTYTASAVGTSSAFTSTTENLRSYRVSGQSVSIGFSDEQRREALEEDDKEEKKKVKKGA